MVKINTKDNAFSFSDIMMIISIFIDIIKIIVEFLQLFSCCTAVCEIRVTMLLLWSFVSYEYLHTAYLYKIVKNEFKSGCEVNNIINEAFLNALFPNRSCLWAKLDDARKIYVLKI